MIFAQTLTKNRLKLRAPCSSWRYFAGGCSGVSCGPCCFWDTRLTLSGSMTRTCCWKTSSKTSYFRNTNQNTHSVCWTVHLSKIATIALPSASVAVFMMTSSLSSVNLTSKATRKSTSALPDDPDLVTFRKRRSHDFVNLCFIFCKHCASGRGDELANSTWGVRWNER